MLRTLLLSAAVAAIAIPAAATTAVTINVTGLDAKAAHASIVQAARAACKVEMRNASAYEQYYLRSSCITNAVADAESRLATTTASATTANPSRSIGR